MNAMDKVNDCFTNAKLDENKGKKHKGLLFVGRDDRLAEEYLQKAKANLELCELYKEKRFDYKLPEEWYYTMYYCALAILAKFGVESRNQRCTALFLRYMKTIGLIEYDDNQIDRLMVYSEKEKRSDVDERQDARYSTTVESEEIMQKYSTMMGVCKECINQCEEVIFSNSNFQLPKELMEKIKKEANQSL